MLFDFDGTLADSFSVFVQVVNRLAEKHGFRKIEESELDRTRKLSAAQMMSHLGLPTWKLPLVASDMRREMAAANDAIELFDGVGTMLVRLRQRGIRTGIVTSNSEGNVRTILGEKNCSQITYFECGLSLFGKASKLRKLHRLAGADSEQVIFVGDEIRDAHAAAKAQVRFAGVTWGYTKQEALAPLCSELLYFDVNSLADDLCER